MKRKPAAPVFKPYVMNQTALLPPSYEEKIPEKHLVRVVNDAVEKIDVSSLLAEYIRRRDFELSSEDVVESAGVCVCQADLFVAADRRSLAGEYSLYVDQRGK
jgi:hypothetical protein